MTDQIFGIDLGTTYSAIAYMNDFGQPEVIRNRESDETTPSVVLFENETNFVVGKEAKNELLLHPDTTVSLIKRHMGTDFNREFFGQTYPPEKISAIILKDLVDYARDGTGIESNKVVITVPAYFGIAEKEATRQAGEIAGLDVVGIVTEPVAAALSVDITGEKSKTVFVYDLGGGTFDCTIMQLSQGAIDVIVIDGKRVLGGADWDAKLFELINAKFIAQAGLIDDPTTDEDFAQKLMTMVEDTKKSLSRKDRVSVTLSYGDALEKVEVTRTEFEEATRTLVDETLEIVRRAFATAQEKRPDLVLDEVLLVGGSSRMPMIEASLENEMGWKLRKTDFDLAVAKGAAVYGSLSTVPIDPVFTPDPPPSPDPDPRRLIPEPFTIHNVLSRSLGVQYARENSGYPGGWEPFIGFEAHANDSLPGDWTFEAYTADNETTDLGIHIFEQTSDVEHEALTSNREVTPEGGAVLRNLPNLPKDSRIDFELHIDSEGKATLSVTEPSTNQKIQMEVSLSVLQKREVEDYKNDLSRLTRRDD
jgi:molecular chaperone DnaK